MSDTPGNVTKDGREFVYVEGVKLGKATPDGRLEIKGCDLREGTKPKKVATSLSELAQAMGKTETA